MQSDISQKPEAPIISAKPTVTDSHPDRPRSASALALSALCCCLFATTAAFATTASEAFEDGNRLFRDDLYWAALLRYSQAGEAGMDTPLLHYNTGIAHYRARQHIRARDSFSKSLASPGLRVVTQYNLGLNAYAAGDVDEALRWFRLARDQDENPKVSRLARIAISRLQQQKETTDPFLVRAEVERKKRDVSDFEFEAQIGFGSDDNVFRTPGQPYIDFADPALPLITPVVQSGAYLPVGLAAKYSINNFEHESFFGAYRFVGRNYQDKELENGNEYSHEFSFGSEYGRTQETRRREVYSAFTIAQHDETYFDPDDGVARTSDGEPINDRMNYLRYGPEVSFRQSGERLSIGARIKGQLWNYDETTDTSPEYDHEFFVLGVSAQYKFVPSSLLRINIDKYSRRYSDRPSYDLDGQPRIGNPDIRYDYLEFGLTARQRIFNSLWFGVNYGRTDRTDRYEGYNDYGRDSYGFDIGWTPASRFSIKLSGNYRIYDYPNAFAFHNPIVGRKTLESADGLLTASYEISRHFSLIVEAHYREVASNDTRIAYDRNQYSLGVRWQQ